MFNEFQHIIKAVNGFKRKYISSELLNKLLPDFHEGLLIFMDDLAKEKPEILKLTRSFNVILEVENDGFEDILVVRVPILEKILDPDAHLSEYISTLDIEEKNSLRKLGLIE